MARLAFAFALTLAVSVSLAWSLDQRTSAGSPLYGDVNCSGQVNSIDSAVLLQLSAGFVNSVACPANADVNGDGQANSLDSALVLQFAAGLITHLGPPSGPTPTNTHVATPTNTQPAPPTNTHQPGATNTPPAPTSTPAGAPVEYPVIYYRPDNPWHDTGIALSAGQRIVVHTTGSVIYDNLHLTGTSADGDGAATGWGPCAAHSLIGWVGAARPAADAPTTLTNVICLGADFDGHVPAGGRLFININDRGGYSNNVGQWYATVTVYP
jgi:hypothetical protein